MSFLFIKFGHYQFIEADKVGLPNSVKCLLSAFKCVVFATANLPLKMKSLVELSGLCINFVLIYEGDNKIKSTNKAGNCK